MVKKLVAKSLQEVLSFIQNGDAYIVAGGTDLMVQKRSPSGVLPSFDKNVCFIANVSELKRIRSEADGIHIGACTTLYEIETSEVAPTLLKTIIRDVASVNIRHFATLAGNIANASPAGDTIVGDVLLDATLKLTSIHGSRYVKAIDFVIGVRKTDLKPGEIIEEFIFPKDDVGVYKWHKVGSRKADSISKLSFAYFYKVDNSVLKECRFAFGSVFSKVVRLLEVEKNLQNISLEELKNKKSEILKAYEAAICPIDDQRSTKRYRKVVAINLLNSAFDEILKGVN